MEAGPAKTTDIPTVKPSTCGNGIREHPEECDENDFGFYTCANVQTRGYKFLLYNKCICIMMIIVPC